MQFPPTPASETLWTTGDLAAYFKISSSAVYPFVKRHHLPMVGIGTRLRFLPTQVFLWLKLRMKNSSPESQEGEDAITLSEPLWDVENLGKCLRMTEAAVYQAVQRHEIPHIKLGSLLRFMPSQIRGWLEASVRNGGKQPPSAEVR